MLTVYSGVDFDDDELPYYEENKSNIKVPTFYQAYLVLCHAQTFTARQRGVFQDAHVLNEKRCSR